MTRILKDLEMMNPVDLLCEDQHLLGVNLEDFVSTPADRRRIWQANLETGIAAAEHVNRKRDLPKTANTRTSRGHTSPTNNISYYNVAAVWLFMTNDE